MNTLVFEPRISGSLWCLLALASLAGWLAYAWYRPETISRRRWVGATGLMALAIALPLVMLLNPTWLEPLPPPAVKPRVTIFVDTSRSMATPDMPNGRTRLASAVEVADQCVRELTSLCDVDVETFAGVTIPVDADSLAKQTASGNSTNLAAPLRAGLDPAVGANAEAGSRRAILLLSDGNHNAPGGLPVVLSAVAAAQARNTPIYTRTFGTARDIDDLSVRLVHAQHLTFAGQLVPVSAMVRRRGKSAESVEVLLREDGRIVDRRQVTLMSGAVDGAVVDAEVEVQFLLRKAAKGMYRYEIAIEPTEGEASTVNNYAMFALRVVDEPIRVLVVEGKPYWDTKFLIRALATDQAVEPTSIVRMTAGRYLERTLLRANSASNLQSETALPEPAAETRKPAAETRARVEPEASPVAESPVPDEREIVESWRVLPGDGSDLLDQPGLLDRYQIVVLGRDSDFFLTAASIRKLKAWISNSSGSLVCYRGQPSQQVNEQLDGLLPVRWQANAESRHRMQLTEPGAALRWLASGSPVADSLGQLPPLATATRVDQSKPLATVIASATDATGEPLVTFQPYGGGRVVVIEGAGMWRWAFLPPSFAGHDDAYPALWQSLLRWLVSGAGLLPGYDLTLRADKGTFTTSEPASATLLYRPEALPAQSPLVELIGESRLQPQRSTASAAGEGEGVYRVNFGALPEGRYEARVVGAANDDPSARAVFDVREIQEEQLDIKARPDLMARIAASSGGLVLDSVPTSEIAKSLATQVAGNRPDRVKRTMAWDRWWVASLLIAIWTACWIVRRRGGLV